MSDLILSVVAAVGVAFAVFLAVRHHRMRSRNDDLLTTGVSAKATVKRIRPDVAEDDLFHVSLEFDEPASTPVEAPLFIAAHALPSVQPGKVVSVLRDKANPGRVILDLRAMGLA